MDPSMANQLSAFQFRPTHQECIAYLLNKVTGTPLPSSSIHHHITPDLDLYDVNQLQDIFTATEQSGHFYFFTKLKKRGNSYVNRKVGKGRWDGDQTNDVEHSEMKIGKYSKLKYREEGSKYDHRFIMTEYTLPKNTEGGYDPLKDHVLCHLARNDRYKNGMKVTKSMGNSMNDESPDVSVDAIPTDSQVHHVAAAAESMELPSSSTSTAPVYDQDQQPQVMDDGSRFNNHGRDPLQYAPAPKASNLPDLNLPYVPSSPAAESISSVVETGLPPRLPSTIDCNSFYSESAPFYTHQSREAPVAPLPDDAVAANTDPNHPQYLPRQQH